MPQLSMFENSYKGKYLKNNKNKWKKSNNILVCVLLKVGLKYMTTSPQNTGGGKLKANI